MFPFQPSPVPIVSKPPPQMTNYQITSGNNLEIRNTSGSQLVSGVGSSPIVLPMIKRDTPSQSQHSIHQSTTPSPSTPSTPDIKVIPANQFIQLKPSGSTQKFVTLKSSPKPVVSVIPKQPITSTPSPLAKQTTIQSPMMSQHQQSFSPTKFTIVRTSTGLSVPSTSTSPIKTIKSPTTPDLSNTSIFDMPIVFADNDGNIPEGSPQKSFDTSSKPPPNIITIGPAVTNHPIMKTEQPMNRIITLQPSLKPNKVVVINKSNMKQVPPNVLSSVTLNKSTSITPTGVKYAKVVISNPLNKGATSTVTSTPTIIPKNLTQVLSNQKIEILNNTIVKQASTSTSIPQQQKFQPVIINVDPSKTTTMKNFVRVGETQIRPISSTSNITIPSKVASSAATVVAPSGSGQVPQLAPGIPGTNTILIKTNSLTHLASRKPTILNRNITVRKLNIMPQSQGQVGGTSSAVIMTSAPPKMTISGVPQLQQQHQQQQPKAP